MNYNLKIDFLSNVKRDEEPLKGRILISEPFSQDLYFHRSVIIITEHNKETSTGFVINKCINVDKNSLVVNFPNINPTISIGGPINSTSLSYIHNRADIINGSLKIGQNLYFGGNWTEVKDALNSGKMSTDNIRFFMGYSGWSKDQLKKEINERQWIVDDLSSDFIFDDTTNLWTKLIKNKGNMFKLWLNIPQDPNDN